MDERIFAARQVEPFCLADIILSGGEVAALALLDACVRLLPGVMGAARSADEESFETGLLEHPHYTRPLAFEGHGIPEVLRSGNHGAIEAWRRARAESDTRAWRPDLWEKSRTSPPSAAQPEHRPRSEAGDGEE
jgi:tRNA (guanine37-N1)-methyltransferase